MSSDNAGGGLRGPRAKPSPPLFECLQECYGIDAAAGIQDLGGSSSLNLLATADGGRCVARVYRPYVSPFRLEAIQTVRGALVRRGIPCARLIPTRSGEPWSTFDGRLIEVEEFVEYDGKMDTWEELETGLSCLGRMHSLLRTIEVSEEGKSCRFANHVEPREALEWTIRAARRLRSWGSDDRAIRLADTAVDLARRVTDAEREFAGSVPRQLVHGDFWDNNVYFKQGRVVLICDFDFMGERARIDDLALTSYFVCSKFRMDPATDEGTDRLRRLMDAYDSGLDRPLSRVERRALPLAIARQPLWGMRWLALLDDEAEARGLVEELLSDVDAALTLIHSLEPGRRVYQ